MPCSLGCVSCFQFNSLSLSSLMQHRQKVVKKLELESKTGPIEHRAGSDVAPKYILIRNTCMSESEKYLVQVHIFAHCFLSLHCAFWCPSASSLLVQALAFYKYNHIQLYIMYNTCAQKHKRTYMCIAMYLCPTILQSCSLCLPAQSRVHICITSLHVCLHVCGGVYLQLNVFSGYFATVSIFRCFSLTLLFSTPNWPIQPQLKYKTCSFFINRQKV